jgi:hypothetical protein
MDVLRSVRPIAIVPIIWIASLVAPMPASAHPAVLCVGQASGCSATIQQALARAHDGDTITIARGTYRGGVVITKSVTIRGAGQHRTRIRGGGPVITVNSSPGHQPNVAISDLTVEGGRVGDGTYQSFGGGIDINPTSHVNVGASVTLRDISVTGNEATATITSPSPSGVKCPHGFCPFAGAFGGGIYNAGTLTIVHSTVNHNRVDGPLSDGDGGGIYSEIGSLTVQRSQVDANRVRPQHIGRFAEGGGIFVSSGALTVTHSRVDGNRADLVTDWPVMAQGAVLNMNANSGGIHVGDDVTVHVSRTTMSRNEVSAIDPQGEPAAFDSGMLVGDSFAHLHAVSLRDGRVVADVATSDEAGPSGSVLEFDGPAVVTGLRLADNTVIESTKSGLAGATNGLAVYDFSNNPRQVAVRDARFVGNHTVARTTTGSAVVTGGAVFNNSLLDLTDVAISGNTGTATGSGATAQGGGIWNGPFLSGPPVTLELHHVHVTRNQVHADSAGGGGIYTIVPIGFHHSTVRDNEPDNCHGC